MTSLKRQRLEDEPASSDDGSKRQKIEDSLNESAMDDKDLWDNASGEVQWRNPQDNSWVPAVYHKEIRSQLLATASSNGKQLYVYPRAQGSSPDDRTAFLSTHQHWSPARHLWPRIQHDVLNRIDRNGFEGDNATKTPTALFHDGRIVLDEDDQPVRCFEDLPIVLSSEIEGWELEVFHRLDTRVRWRDIRARLPSQTETVDRKEGDLLRMRALGIRRMKFREHHGIIPWWARPSSKPTVDFLKARLPPWALEANSTIGVGKLTEDEKARFLAIKESLPAKTPKTAEQCDDEDEDYGCGKEPDRNRKIQATALLKPSSAAARSQLSNLTKSICSQERGNIRHMSFFPAVSPSVLVPKAPAHDARRPDNISESFGGNLENSQVRNENIPLLEEKSELPPTITSTATGCDDLSFLKFDFSPDIRRQLSKERYNLDELSSFDDFVSTGSRVINQDHVGEEARRAPEGRDLPRPFRKRRRDVNLDSCDKEAQASTKRRCIPNGELHPQSVNVAGRGTDIKGSMAPYRISPSNTRSQEEKGVPLSMKTLVKSAQNLTSSTLSTPPNSIFLKEPASSKLESANKTSSKQAFADKVMTRHMAIDFRQKAPQSPQDSREIQRVLEYTRQDFCAWLRGGHEKTEPPATESGLSYDDQIDIIVAEFERRWADIHPDLPAPVLRMLGKWRGSFYEWSIENLSLL